MFIIRRERMKLLVLWMCGTRRMFIDMGNEILKNLKLEI